MKVLVFLMSALMTLTIPAVAQVDAQTNPRITPVNIKWTSHSSDGGVNVHLYMYWSYNCPHCHVAMDFLKTLPAKYPWIKLHFREVSKNKKNLAAYFQMADALGEEGGAVPAFFYCGYMYAGYTGNDTTGQWLLEEMKACRQNPV